MVDVGGPGRSPLALPPLVLLEMSSGCQPSSGITAPCRGTKARVFPLLAWDLSGPSCCRTPFVELSGPSLSLHYSQASHLAQSERREHQDGSWGGFTILSSMISKIVIELNIKQWPTGTYQPIRHPPVSCYLK